MLCSSATRRGTHTTAAAFFDAESKMGVDGRKSPIIKDLVNSVLSSCFLRGSGLESMNHKLGATNQEDPAGRVASS
jgi:hypothetical protein